MLKRIYRLHYPILFDKIHKGINSLKDYCKDALAKIAQLLRELSKALHQGCRFNPRSGNIQEPTNERTGTTNLDISLSFSFSLSLSVSHWVSPLSSFSPKSFFFKKVLQRNCGRKDIPQSKQNKTAGEIQCCLSFPMMSLPATILG